jgi:RNA polymerase sigma-70 factor (ECF subfamily)
MSVDDDAASSDAAFDEAATAEQLAKLEAALLTLPRFRREVFLAHRIDDLSYAEIAERTGVSMQRIEREMA